MDYDAELERVANALQTAPRKLSEANVRILGALNHFETFEDELIDNESGANAVIGKRLSLSGSIVVLDLDFVKPDNILAVSVSLSRETASESTWSAMSPYNDPSGQLLASLRRPRLDAFSRMLEFLSRCDRFSTKDVDCFRALDLVSEVIHLYIQQTSAQNVPALDFGTPVMNPPNRIGLGLKYLDTKPSAHYALLDVFPGLRQEFCLKKVDSVENYLDLSTLTWKPLSDQLPNELDARAELMLTLDPPVVISETLAVDLQAVVTDRSPAIDERLHNSSFSVPRHPRFVRSGNSHDDFDVNVGVMLPFRLVEVSQIPITGPAMIPEVLKHLKQFSLASHLVNSVLHGTETPWTTEATDLNIADALAMQEQPVHRQKIPLSITWRCLPENIMEITVQWVLSDLQLIILLKPGQELELQVQPDSHSRLNKGDVHKLLAAGELALAISYAYCGSGQINRRASSMHY